MSEKKKKQKKTDSVFAAPENLQEMLMEGERVLASSVIHTAIFWKSFAVLILTVLVMLFLAFEIGLVLFIACLLMFSHALLKRQILLLVITDKRVLARYGILQIDVVDVHFDKIESVELERMLPGYIFGYANVVVMGTGNRYIVIPYVANAVQMRRAFNEITLKP